MGGTFKKVLQSQNIVKLGKIQELVSIKNCIEIKSEIVLLRNDDEKESQFWFRKKCFKSLPGAKDSETRYATTRKIRSFDSV